MNLRNRKFNNLIDKLRNYNQQGIGFCGEGSCDSGNYIFSATTFFIPLKTSPSSIVLSNIDYTNSQNLSVVKKSRFGFVTRAQAINSGASYCTFDWNINF